MAKKVFFFLILCSNVYILFFLPELSSEAKWALMIIVFAIYLWATQLIPIGFTSLWVVMMFTLLEIHLPS
ncbi:hypothetical protein [Aquibacillus sediminis]|uniref:hypothetical protein n=1 Tax=Aquibacillus sediminis TaxID=2574734 RepID=UPI00110913C8|nr:hypothetical protein [Aquibacillus sediminis]